MAFFIEPEILPIRLTRYGEWLHGPTLLHARVAELFAAHVVPHADGRYTVELGNDEQPVEVEDAAYFVRRVDMVEAGDGTLASITVHLSDGASEPLNSATLMQGADNALYCRVVRQNLSVPARFLTTPYNAVAAYAELDGADAFLRVGGRRWPIRAYVRAPLGHSPLLAGRGLGT